MGCEYFIWRSFDGPKHLFVLFITGNLLFEFWDMLGDTVFQNFTGRIILQN